jgi:hypothetical protein
MYLFVCLFRLSRFGNRCRFSHDIISVKSVTESIFRHHHRHFNHPHHHHHHQAQPSRAAANPGLGSATHQHFHQQQHASRQPYGANVFDTSPRSIHTKAHQYQSDQQRAHAQPTTHGDQLHSNTAIKQHTRLCIYDFDGTLVRTPGSEEGVKLFEELTGKQWEITDPQQALANGYPEHFIRRGWWGRAESLQHPVFDHTKEGRFNEFKSQK